MNEYWAIIISFNPDINKLKATISNLKKQGFSVLVVDNCSANREELNSILSNNELLSLNKNYGIAKALNRGMAYAVENGAKWVLSSDQDTIIDRKILSVYKEYINFEKVGALCPSVKRDNGYDSGKDNDQVHVVERCPTAGFFLSAYAWEESGKYDDWLFIDYVDYDICMKLKLSGFRIYQVPETYVLQELGNYHEIKWLRRIGEFIGSSRIQNLAQTYNHSDLRNYYFVRNSLYYREKYKKSIDYGKETAFILKWELKKLLLEPHRLKTMKSAIKGYAAYRKKMMSIRREV